MTTAQKIFIAVVALVIVFLILLFTGIVSGLKERNPPKIELEFWSVFDDSEVYRPLIEAYQAANLGVTINYRKKSIATYEKELLDALASGRGPDIFAIHNSWLWQYYNKISVLPAVFSDKSKGMDYREYKNTFIDTASSDFVSGANIFAVPFYTDSLALYYNRSMFNSEALVGAPKTWEDFKEYSKKLSKFGENKEILRSGAALGTAKNINRAADIALLMMKQKGVSLTDGNGKALFDPQSKAAEALGFYAGFSDRNSPDYSWNGQMPYSIDAFAEGKAAMMVGYSYNIETIYAKAPHLNFNVSEIPQFKDSSDKKTYSNYFGHTVSFQSKNPEAAWKFILYVASQDGMRFYSEAAKRPVSRKDLISWQEAKDELLGVFAKSGLYSSAFIQYDSARNENIFSEMIETVSAKSKSPSFTISEAAQKINASVPK